jgi:hypothetical protein
VRHRVEEALDLDVIVDADTSQAPLGELEVIVRQSLDQRPFDRVEQLATTHPDSTHLAAVHPLDRHGDGGIAFH